MTNSVTVAMTINGMVKYEMRLLFNRCHGENPIFCSVAESGAGCGFEELEFFINECLRTYNCHWRTYQVKYDLIPPKDLNCSSHIVIQVALFNVSSWRFTKHRLA